MRECTGTKAYKAPPVGTLKEWHWRALAKAYAARDEGLEGSYGDYANIGRPTWLRLRDYKRGALIEERASGFVEQPRDWVVRLALSDPHHRGRLGALGTGMGALPRALS